MEKTRFYNKLNKVDGKLYVIEEKITMPEGGVYDAPLEHDNIVVSSLNVYTGPKLTGERIQTWALSTPSLTPWKRIIRIQTEAPVVYITYETDGDTVEADDINELQTAVAKTQTGVNAETDRATEAEAALLREVETETGRATEAESALLREVETEKGRAAEAESALNDALEAESARARAAETALDERKANTADMARELDNRYTKDQVFTKEEVLKGMEDLIAAAPEALDTFKEIADALGNDPDFAATVINLLAGKVDKEDGKQLSANDYSDSEKAMAADANAKKHTHENGEVLDKITQPLLDDWNEAFGHTGNKNNPHGITKAQLGLENVENKSGAEIRAEMTTQEVIDALGYKPPEASAVYIHPDSGVTAGSYKGVTVDARGHVTAGSNPTTLAGYGITDAAAKVHDHDGVYLKKGKMLWSDLGGG